MLQLSHLAGLWALTALALPLALHLWRPPARTVRLGSVRFLQGLPRRRLNNLRWRERLLLFSRLLLLAILALLLAAPLWRRMVSRVPQRWVLVSPGASLTGTALDHVRALLVEGYALHRFTAGFPLVELRSIDTNSSTDVKREVIDIWSLIREADAALPEHSELVVYTDGRIAGLRGTRPTLRRCQVEWMQMPADDDINKWIQSARLIGVGESAALEVSIGFSNTTATRFYSQQILAHAGRVPLTIAANSFNFEVIGDSGKKFSVRFLTADGQPAGEWVDAKPQESLRVSIIHDADRAEDARYVEAAIRAAAQVDKIEPSVITKTNDQPITGEEEHLGWIFWLSRQVVPDEITRLVSEGKTKLLTDAMAIEAATIQESWITALADGTKPILPAETVTIKQRIVSPSDTKIPLWVDGFGEPLLTRSLSAKGERLNFLSRFNPAWNDLPTTDALAVMMRSLLADARDLPDSQIANDRRTVDSNQTAPNRDDVSRGAMPVNSSIYEETDLHTLFWVAAFLCFCLERFLAHWKVAPIRQTGQRETGQPALAEARS